MLSFQTSTLLYCSIRCRVRCRCKIDSLYVERQQTLKGISIMLKKSFEKCFQGEAAAEKIIEIFQTWTQDVQVQEIY